MLLHAPAARPAAEDVGVVEEAIEERADGGDIAEELAPVLDRPVRAEQGADPLVAALDELEEVLGRGGREFPHAQVIDDEEGDGRELGHPLAAGAGERGVGELLEESVRFAVQHAMALQDERVAERLGEMTLARARRAEEDDVLARHEEAAGGEREDEVAVHLLVEGEVEAVEGLVGIAKLGLLEPAGEEAIGAAGEVGPGGGGGGGGGGGAGRAPLGAARRPEPGPSARDSEAPHA